VENNLKTRKIFKKGSAIEELNDKFENANTTSEKFEKGSIGSVPTSSPWRQRLLIAATLEGIVILILALSIAIQFYK